MIIITLTKNSANTISQTAESLKHQSFKDFNWIIVDDNSSDNTISLIKSFEIDNTKIINGPDTGIFNAYNFVLDYIKINKIDDIIFFIHSDDLLYDNQTLETVNAIFEKHKPDCLFGNIAYFNKDNSNLFRFWNSSIKSKQIKIDENFYKISKLSHKDLIYGYSFPHNSFFFDSKMIEKLPYYSTKYPFCSDYLWSLKVLLSNNLNFYFYDNYLIKMKYGGMSTTYKNLIKQQIFDFKIIKDVFYSFHKSNLICFFTLIMKKLRKLKQFFKK
jgi:glycosyltransferase